ncbi:MAG: T9SS type A sorting domain-containing protein, partial [Elusimicrobiota bacterium]
MKKLRIIVFYVFLGIITPLPIFASLGDAVDNTSLSWTTGGNANWFGQSSEYYYGGDASESGDISDSQSSYIQTAVVGPGTLKFYWKVSSESGWDHLRFYIDTTKQDEISGTVNWGQKTYTIYSGNHTLKWSYEKDTIYSNGSDCGWLDKVEWTGTAGSQQNDADSGGDAGNTLDSATAITPEITYTAYLDSNDSADYYKFYVTSGQTISISATFPSGTDFWGEVYDPNGSQKSSTTGYSIVADSTGYWRWAAKRTYGEGQYSFKISVYSQNDANSGGDAGNSVSSATTLGYWGYFGGCSDEEGYIDSDDTEDYYKFPAPADNEIKATISSSSTLTANVYLLDSYGNILISGQLASTITLSYFTYKSDDYYLEVEQNYGSGIYTFSIDFTPDQYCVIPYPNPFNISKGHTKITFAGSGVPYGKIRIYTIDGKHIKTLEETNGNKSIELYPIQENIPSGIYLYGT